MTPVTPVPWVKVVAALPAVVLIGAGTVLAAGGGASSAEAVARSAPAVTVPPTPLSRPGAPVLPPLPSLPAPPEARTDSLAAAYSGAVPDALRTTGIPEQALAAYRRAATLVDAADPACRVDWALVAAIGNVESDHGRYAGNGLDENGTVRPGIYGIPLNGQHATATIRDTDGGTYDRDPVWDRAVGPMQFIPGTWRVVGVDADGDGVKNPQNLADAATATAVYLCSGPGDLTDTSDLYAAVLRYNQSDAYVRQVTAIADSYRGGVTVLPSERLTAAQRTGAPYLPSGEPQTMASYDPAVAARPAGTGPGSKGSSGSSGPAGATSGGSGAGGSSDTGAPSGDTDGAAPQPTTTSSPGGADALTGTVGTVTAPLTGGGSTPWPGPTSPTPTPTPSTSSPTPAQEPTCLVLGVLTVGDLCL